MKCPTCSVNLVMSDRQGVEIDYCPECRGVWLDRGELDKIIERSATQAQPAAEPRVVYREPERRESHHQDHSYYKKHKKESWLGEIFDF